MPGSRGPLKLPSHLRAVPDTTKANSAAEVMPRCMPDKPADLTPQEGDVWDMLVGPLATAGLLAESDIPAVRLAIRHYLAAMKASDALLAADSVSLHDAKNDRDQKHPADAVFRMQSRLFLDYAQQFGATFVSRARAVQPSTDEGTGNPFA